MHITIRSMSRLLLGVVAVAAVKVGFGYETPKVVVSFDNQWDAIGRRWDQQYPHNAIINQRYQAATGTYKSWFVGCVATSGCMIQDYYKFPTSISNAANNGSDTGASFGSQSASSLHVDMSYVEGDYNWNNINDTMKATVSWNTSIATKMKFKEISVGPSTVTTDYLAAALRSYFNFASGLNVTGFSKNYPALYEHFIYQQLRIGNPVVLSIAGSGGAHCVVANGFGYNAAGDPIVHIAYGWSGSYDGWHKLSNMAGGYSRVDAAVIAIRPNDYKFAPITGRVVLEDGTTGVQNEPVTYRSAKSNRTFTTQTDMNGYYAIAVDFFEDGNGTVTVQGQTKSIDWRIRENNETTVTNPTTGQQYTINPSGFINRTSYITNKGSAFSVTYDDYENVDPVYNSFPKAVATITVTTPTNTQTEIEDSNDPVPGVYTVHFDTGTGGTVIADQRVQEGYFVSKVSNPVRSGYTFKHWTVSGHPELGTFTYSTEFWPYAFDGMTIVAVWEQVGGGTGTGTGTEGGNTGTGTEGGNTGTEGDNGGTTGGDDIGETYTINLKSNTYVTLSNSSEYPANAKLVVVANSNLDSASGNTLKISAPIRVKLIEITGNQNVTVKMGYTGNTLTADQINVSVPQLYVSGYGYSTDTVFISSGHTYFKNGSTYTINYAASAPMNISTLAAGENFPGGGSVSGGGNNGGSTGGNEGGNTGTDPVNTDPVSSTDTTSSALVTSFDSHYSYQLTEDYWDARKQAIKDKKALFVLSGSDSCNNCAYVKAYLQNRANDIKNKVVVYFARLQNAGGNAIMQGRLPQYGTYDPRTIDAFTGTLDANGNFHSNWAWYSGQDNKYYSAFGWAENQVAEALQAAEGKTYGNFTGFTLEGPSAAFVNMPANYKLFANFSDGKKMAVDHGVEWTIVSGSANITCDNGTDYSTYSKGVGTLKATGGGTVKIRCRNTFYDFGTTENVLEKTIRVVNSEEVASIKITSLEFNLEDSTEVQLRCEATLTNGEKADALPNWTVAVKSVDPYPAGSGFSTLADPFVELDGTVNGKVNYVREERWVGINRNVYYGTDVQDHKLTVTAEMNGKSDSAEVRVWGPSRMIPSEWSLITQPKCAPGSVVRASCTELTYTYKGQVYTTRDSGAATYAIQYYFDSGHGDIVNGATQFQIPVDYNLNNRTSGHVRLFARKTGGKYTRNDDKESIKKTLEYYPDWKSCYNVTNMNADDDNDGFTNLEEYILGTEPDRDSSRWAFTSSHFDWPNSIYYRVMYMQSQFPGRTYTLEGSSDGGDTWHTLGVAPGATPGDANITGKDVAKADTCRLFRVKAKLDDATLVPASIGQVREVQISGYGAWTGQTFHIDPGTKWQAFVVDANNEKYDIHFDFDTANLASGTAMLSIPAAQTLKSTQSRIKPTVALQNQGWSFTCATNGVFMTYSAVKGEPPVTPVVDPTDEPTTGDNDEPTTGGNTNPSVNPSLEPTIAPVTSFNDHYAYQLTENYWDARKQAIKDKKALFVLSGSDSCNNCAYVKSYLQNHANEIKDKVVVYFARLQNAGGNAIMQGRLPQYGTYDPRTIDAFTGTLDANGQFHSNWAWYSGQDNCYYSAFGWAENQVVDALNAAKNKTYGNFTGYSLEGPSAAFVDMPANYKLFANFDDGKKIAVDHGVEWTVVSGSATMSCDDGTNYATYSKGVGTLSATATGTVRIRCRNTFYDFGATSNVLETEVRVVNVSDVKSIKITSLEFNLEDSTDVQLRCEATLNDNSIADALPTWTVALSSVDPYPTNSGFSQLTDPFVEIDNTVNGKVNYIRDRKWTAQTGWQDYNGTDVQDHKLAVTATLNGKTDNAIVQVYGPSRMVPTQWSLITQPKCAPGSVVRASCTELTYTYKGKLHTTRDSGAATYTIQYYFDSNHGEMFNGATLFQIPVGYSLQSQTTGYVRLFARKTGGKYTQNDDKESLKQTLVYYPSWETCYGVANDDTDFDNDGFTNHQEYLLGTEPDNANSRWAFTSSHFDWPNSIYYRVMYMQSQYPGRTYTLEGSSDGGEHWQVLGVASGAAPGDANIENKNVAAADNCRLFRVKAKLDATNEEITITGYGAWTDQTFEITPNTKWQAFVVDANNESYDIHFNFSTEGLNNGTPMLSIPAAQTLKSTQSRIKPTVALQDQGWYFTCTTNGVFMTYAAYKSDGAAEWNNYTKDTETTQLLNGLDLTDGEKTLLIQRFGQTSGTGKSLVVPETVKLNGSTLSKADTITAALVFDNFADDEELEFEIPEFDPSTGKVGVRTNKTLRGGRVVLYGTNDIGGSWNEVDSLSGSEIGTRELSTGSSYRFFHLKIER